MLQVPFSHALRGIGGLQDARAYKIKFVPSFTLLGQQSGEGWYILTPSHRSVGPIPSKERAEDVLCSALEQLGGKALTPDERQNARDIWASS